MYSVSASFTYSDICEIIKVVAWNCRSFFLIAVVFHCVMYYLLLKRIFLLMANSF